MRIAIINEGWGGGAGRCARDLERAWRRDHEVLFLPQEGGDTWRSAGRALHAFQPEVVHCHSFYGWLPYRSLSALSRAFPVCYTVHDPRPIGTLDTACWTCERNGWCRRCPLPGAQGLVNPFFISRLKKRLCHWACRGDLKIVAPSQWMADRLRQHELSRFEILTIPNGVDLEKFRPMPPARSRFGLPKTGPVLLHVAYNSASWALNERKGLRYLAEAFVQQIKPRFPSAVLAVAGETVAPNYPGVVPLGAVAQEALPALLCSADLFVAPTLADNLPYTVLEAMACGRAVVASRVGGVPEQVLEGQTGRLVPARDAARLGEALVDLLARPEQMRQFGAAGRARVEQLFGMNQFTQAYERLLAGLAAGVRSSRPNPVRPTPPRLAPANEQPGAVSCTRSV